MWSWARDSVRRKLSIQLLRREIGLFRRPHYSTPPSRPSQNWPRQDSERLLLSPCIPSTSPGRISPTGFSGALMPKSLAVGPSLSCPIAGPARNHPQMMGLTRRCSLCQHPMEPLPSGQIASVLPRVKALKNSVVSRSSIFPALGKTQPRHP